MIYLSLFLEFFKIGLFSFGGAFGMLPLIEEVVVSHRWLSSNDFYSFVGICESTPGPIAVNIATYVGSIQGGFLGSIVATLGVILLSFILILLIASVLKKFIENRFVKYFLQGVEPVIIALILSTGIFLLMNEVGIEMKHVHFEKASFMILMILLGCSMIYKRVFKRKISSITLILLSSIIGIIVCSILHI